MRSTCCLYVDTGYLLASAATRVTGTSLRSGINVDYAKLINTLVDTAQTQSGLPVLRVYWYDSARNGVPDYQQERIGELAKVKLRLGRFGVNGEQKGVDLRIGLDLVAHARNNASDVFFLVSGDDDLTEAVEEAQVHGVQVVVLAVPTVDGKSHGVNRHLIRASDDLMHIDGSAIDGSVVKVERGAIPALQEPAPTPVPKPSALTQAAQRPPVPSPPKPAARTPLDLATGTRTGPPPRPTGTLAYTSSTGSTSHVMPGYDTSADQDTIDSVVDQVLASFRVSADTSLTQQLERARPSIPRDIDRALLLDASEALDRDDLDEAIRFRLRSRFWEKYDEPQPTA
ncbi:MAG: NYN domain-containing protein [Gordonia sp. (in: high G+C Gram-positive bacteria)]|uniref:NYN domain-containing protein n=1 Tax=Gordonia TaxID=2053 RepID=UPI0032679E0D